MELLDCSIVSRLTNLADVNKLLHESHHHERLLDSGLEDLQRKRAGMEDNLAKLNELCQEQLDLAKADAEGLVLSLNQTSNLSEKVSRKVRELDAAQSCAQETLNKVGRLVSRTRATEGVQQAMASNDLEAAVRHIEQFLSLEKEFGKAIAGSLETTEQEKVLWQTREELLQHFRGKVEAASREGNQNELLRYIKIFAPLGANEEGLQYFTRFLMETVKKRAESGYTSLLETADVPPDFIEALTGLLKDIGTLLQEHEQFILLVFGGQALLQVIDGLQKECDDSGSRLLQRYIRHHHLEQFVQEIRNHQATRRTTSSQANPSGLDPRQIEGVLEEMLVLCQRAEEYNQFMLEKAAGGMDGKPLPAAHENAFRSGLFNTMVRELTSYYINLEEFYIEQSVEKGIQIDEWTADALSTSMVDDVFFILQKCSQRGLATGNLQCVSAILGQINTVLLASLRPALDSRWKGASGALLQALSASIASEAAATGKDEDLAAAAFNNIDLSASYAMKLQERLEMMAADTFPAVHDRERIQSVLADVIKTAGNFRTIADRAIDHLCSGIMLHLRELFEEADASTYELTEAEYEASEADFTWVDRLLNLLNAVLQWFQPLFTEGNYHKLISNLLDKVVNRLEASMHLKHFNQLGGLLLDRNVRVMTSSLSEVTQWTVRDRFARLSQMATILSLESVSEILEYWGEASEFSWRFTESQIRAILGQRTDFNNRDIATLPL